MRKIEVAPEIYFRYDDHWWSDSVHLRTFKVVKFTPKGCWVVDITYEYWDTHYKRFILYNTRKKFACPTKEEAMESFLIRKRRQLAYLEKHAKQLRRILGVAEKEEDKLNEENNIEHDFGPKRLISI